MTIATDIATETITPEQRLEQLGIVLPAASAPRGNFEAYVLDGNLLYLSGKGSPLRDEMASVPKVGREITAEEARQHARTVGLHLVSTMQAALGNLSRVRRVVKVLGMVNATPDFMQHTEVVNGCSDLLVEVFGDAGRHARSAVGVGSLPRGFAVEIEAIVSVKD
jgi:enamine deaminase RidA (YjgF/YER057c/UK114 family)